MSLQLPKKHVNPKHPVTSLANHSFQICDALKVFGPVVGVRIVGPGKAIARFSTPQEANYVLQQLSNPSSPWILDDKLIRVELNRDEAEERYYDRPRDRPRYSSKRVRSNNHLCFH